MLALRHPLASKGVFFDLEGRRYETTLKFHPLVDPAQVVDVTQFTEDYADDPIRTFEVLVESIRKEITSKKYELIVIDGISDIRRMAADKWCVDHNRERPKTAGDWNQINMDTKDVIFRVFNYARVLKKYVVVTSLITDEYRKGEATGRKIPDCKEYIMARADEVFYTKSEDLRFYVRRKKSPRGPTDWIDITEEQQ